MWQVQLTTGNELVLPPKGIAELREQLATIPGVALADCLQEQHECTAGLRSCGILWDGGVVGCLAERTYIPTKDMTTYGELVGNNRRSLKEIWESEFRDVRFGGTRKSCRDCIKYPKCKEVAPIQTVTAPPAPWPPPSDWVKPLPQSPGQPIVVMYAVASPSDTIIYGVTQPYHTTTGDSGSTFKYGVSSPHPVKPISFSGMNTLMRYGVFGGDKKDV